ncbi:MAG TPA: MarR family transcriptional regulator [Steroidobacteraceae bacterium]|nr:MarR family transcriptional regulator [Steroidobacteraceae bacterium]
MSEPNVEQELKALARLSKTFTKGLGSDERSASRIIWHIIRLARHAEQRLEFEVHRPLGWSWAGFRIMVNAYALDSIEPSQLAAILGVARPTVTSNLDRLERDGLLVRQTDPDNRRRVLVVLTNKGRAAVEQAIPLQIAVETELLNCVPSGQRPRLEKMLNVMLRSFRDTASKP